MGSGFLPGAEEYGRSLHKSGGLWLRQLSDCGVFFFKLSYLFLTLDVTLLFLSRTGHQAALAEACRGIVGIEIKTVTWQTCG